MWLKKKKKKNYKEEVYIVIQRERERGRVWEREEEISWIGEYLVRYSYSKMYATLGPLSLSDAGKILNLQVSQ